MSDETALIIIKENFDYRIKKYEEHINGLKELGCPEPILQQVISIYTQLCNDKKMFMNGVHKSREY